MAEYGRRASLERLPEQDGVQALVGQPAQEYANLIQQPSIVTRHETLIDDAPKAVQRSPKVGRIT